VYGFLLPQSQSVLPLWLPELFHFRPEAVITLDKKTGRVPVFLFPLVSS